MFEFSGLLVTTQCTKHTSPIFPNNHTCKHSFAYFSATFSCMSKLDKTSCKQEHYEVMAHNIDSMTIWIFLSTKILAYLEGQCKIDVLSYIASFLFYTFTLVHHSVIGFRTYEYILRKQNSRNIFFSMWESRKNLLANPFFVIIPSFP